MKRYFGRLFYLCLLSTVCGVAVSNHAAWGEEPTGTEAFSFGKGPVEVMVFTDYFCEHCQRVEPYLEAALDELSKMDVKIIFVDKPDCALTLTFSKYFLFAVKEAETFDEILRIRRLLFDLAEENTISNEEELHQKIKESEIPMSFFDFRPVFLTWMQILETYNVITSPECIVLQPGMSPQILIGDQNVQEGLSQFIDWMSTTYERGKTHK